MKVHNIVTFVFCTNSRGHIDGLDTCIGPMKPAAGGRDSGNDKEEGDRLPPSWAELRRKKLQYVDNKLCATPSYRF